MEYTDFENRMKEYNNRKNPRKVREVLVSCAYCGKENWQSWQRVKTYLEQGKNNFCSSEHSSLWYAEQHPSEIEGKENARFTWDEKRGNWYAHWTENKKQKNTTKARWLWEMYYGEVPNGYWVNFIDENPANCELDNLKLILRGERMSRALMGHVLSDETKKKIGDKHRGIKLTEEHKFNIGRTVEKRWLDGKFNDVHLGENHYWWRGGVPKEYPKEFNEKLKEIIRQRDNYKCRICDNRKRRQEIHHISGTRTDNSPENLINLCYVCHHLIHSKKKNVPIEILAFRSMLFWEVENL